MTRDFPKYHARAEVWLMSNKQSLNIRQKQNLDSSDVLIKKSTLITIGMGYWETWNKETLSNTSNFKVTELLIDDIKEQRIKACLNNTIVNYSYMMTTRCSYSYWYSDTRSNQWVSLFCGETRATVSRIRKQHWKGSNMRQIARAFHQFAPVEDPSCKN